MEDFALPLEMVDPPISMRTVFNAAPIKKAKLPGVAVMILMMRTMEEEEEEDNASVGGMSTAATNGTYVRDPSIGPVVHSPAEALAAQMKGEEDCPKSPEYAHYVVVVVVVQ
eukprot:jgi/Tetstr1/427302/TSEL_017471.t1